MKKYNKSFFDDKNPVLVLGIILQCLIGIPFLIYYVFVPLAGLCLGLIWVILNFVFLMFESFMSDIGAAEMPVPFSDWPTEPDNSLHDFWWPFFGWLCIIAWWGLCVSFVCEYMGYTYFDLTKKKEKAPRGHYDSMVEEFTGHNPGTPSNVLPPAPAIKFDADIAAECAELMPEGLAKRFRMTRIEKRSIGDGYFVHLLEKGTEPGNAGNNYKDFGFFVVEWRDGPASGFDIKTGDFSAYKERLLKKLAAEEHERKRIEAENAKRLEKKRAEMITQMDVDDEPAEEKSRRLVEICSSGITLKEKREAVLTMLMPPIMRKHFTGVKIWQNITGTMTRVYISEKGTHRDLKPDYGFFVVCWKYSPERGRQIVESPAFNKYRETLGYYICANPWLIE